MKKGLIKWSWPGNGSQMMCLIKHQFIMMKMGLMKCSRRQVIGRRGNGGIEDPLLHCPSLSLPLMNQQLSTLSPPILVICCYLLDDNVIVEMVLVTWLWRDFFVPSKLSWGIVGMVLNNGKCDEDLCQTENDEDTWSCIKVTMRMFNGDQSVERANYQNAPHCVLATSSL